MLNFLLFILLLAGFFILMVVFSLLGVVRSIFGLGRKKHPQEHPWNDDEPDSPQKNAMVFGSNEGEYVDFEEIKEEKEKANR